MRWMVPDNPVRRRKMFIRMKKLQEIRNDNLRTRHLLLKCRRVIWIINSSVEQYTWRCKSPWRWLKDIKHWSLTRQRLLLFQNLLTRSKYHHKSLSSFCCSLPVWNQSLLTFSPLANCHGPVLILRLRFLSFFNGALLPNWRKMFEFEVLILVVQ